ncbi:MAG: hypothetical protein PHR75_01760 [Sulfurovum sp.]|nr:hypothetical protein [Sulfurovum sp.]MDD3602596.1 hypothetical protein [Sulfurovum sp.]
MKQTMIALSVLLALNGCQGDKEKQAEHDAKVAQEAREQLLKELKAQEEEEEKEKNSKLSQIGITVDKGIITVDTNKTKGFFLDLSNKLEDKMKSISEDINRGAVNEKDAGIEINHTHINIDLNKTKSFLENWKEKIQALIKEFDSMTKEIDEKTNNEQRK